MQTFKTLFAAADFLRNYSLLVDVARKQLLTQLTVQGVVSSKLSPSPTLLPKDPDEFTAILADFPAVSQACNNEQAVKHNVTHHIKMTGPPVCARPRRLAPN